MSRTGRSTESESGFLVVRGWGREGMITKDVRDIFGVMEMFQNRAVVMAAQLRKLSPRTPVQSVRASLLGRRADRMKTEGAVGPGPRR